MADTYLNQDSKAAVSCYCKGIQEAHEPPFCIPMYYGLAQLFSKKQEFDLASASLSKLIEIYNSNGWHLKPEHEELLHQGWFDATAIETTNIDAEIKARANDALQYTTKKLEMAVGVVDAHHRSGKGFSIYIDLNKKLSARQGVFFGKKERGQVSY